MQNLSTDRFICPFLQWQQIQVLLARFKNRFDLCSAEILTQQVSWRGIYIRKQDKIAVLDRIPVIRQITRGADRQIV